MLKINSTELLNMTLKEIENYLNDSIKTFNFESIEADIVRCKAIDFVNELFDDSIHLRIYDYTRMLMSVGKLKIVFKIAVKNTGEMVKKTRLKNADVKKINKFTLHDVAYDFYFKSFDNLDYDNFLITVSNRHHTRTLTALTHRTEKISEILSENILLSEIQLQNEHCFNLKTRIIYEACQPHFKKIVIGTLSLTFNEEVRNNILKQVETNNKEVIDSEYKRILDYLAD